MRRRLAAVVVAAAIPMLAASCDDNPGESARVDAGSPPLPFYSADGGGWGGASGSGGGFHGGGAGGGAGGGGSGSAGATGAAGTVGSALCDPVAEACPGAIGSATACCSKDDLFAAWCGFDYGHGCVPGAQLADTCGLSACGPLPAVADVAVEPCCPDGSDARCGHAGKCGVMLVDPPFDLRGSFWTRLPLGCVELNQPGEAAADCPGGKLFWIGRGGVNGSSYQAFDVAGCRRADGRCGLQYDLFNLGCINPDLLRDVDKGGVECTAATIGGFADAGTPPHGADGSRCFADAGCVSGKCSTPDLDPGTCARGVLGDECASDPQCDSGICTSDGTYPGRCTNGADWDLCNAPEDCASGICADGSPLYNGQCTSGAAGSLCAADADCVDHFCLASGYCTSGAVGAACGGPEDCKSGVCVVIDAPFYAPPTMECSSGQPCTQDGDCSSGFCAWTETYDRVCAPRAPPAYPWF